MLVALALPAPASAHPHPKLWAWYRASGAKCITAHEGSWTSNTGNGYYGAFQMSMWFQERFAPKRLAAKGTADHWRPFRQVIVVRRVVRDYGWGQWSTAPMCGL